MSPTAVCPTCWGQKSRKKLNAPNPGCRELRIQDVSPAEVGETGRIFLHQPGRPHSQPWHLALAPSPDLLSPGGKQGTDNLCAWGESDRGEAEGERQVREPGPFARVRGMAPERPLHPPSPRWACIPSISERLGPSRVRTLLCRTAWCPWARWMVTHF